MPSSISSQHDAAWIDSYRSEVSFDPLWMLTPAHFATGSSEQEEWNRLFPLRGDSDIQRTLEAMLVRGRQRELLASIAEQRNPHFSYPAISLDEVRRRRQNLLTLKEQMVQHEANEIVRQLYTGEQEEGEQGAIPYYTHFLCLLEATALGDGETFWRHISAIYPVPTLPEMRYALSRVKWCVQRGQEQEHTKEISQQLNELLEETLSLPLSDIPDTEELHLGPTLDVSLYGKTASSTKVQELPPEAVMKLFSALLRDQGSVGWEAVVDYAASNTRIEPGNRRYIVAGVSYPFSKVIEQVAHEWGAHIAPRLAGEHSPLGLLGIGTGSGALVTEEGLGLYYEWELAKRTGQRFDESKVWLGTLATGLAAGMLTPPQKFLALYRFFELFLTLYRLIWRGDEDLTTAQGRARTLAQTRCLRTYRGVPAGSRPGICSPKDAVYERGFLQVYEAVQRDKTILDWLAAGVFALDQVHDLRALGVNPPTRSPRALLERPDLESYILSLKVDESAPN